MRKIALRNPLVVEGVEISSITIHDPNDRHLHAMRKSRKSSAGFTYGQTIAAARRLTAFGDVSLRTLSALDYAELALVIEEIFQAAAGRRAFWFHKEAADA